MNKATFIRKYYGKGFERDFVFMVYGYRGHEYTVYENRAKGNEPLSWQHKSEQARIDRLIEDWESKPKSRIGMRIRHNTGLINSLNFWRLAMIQYLI